jgi:hypothetical protein
MKKKKDIETPQTMEQKVADAIFQRQKEVIIGEKTYSYPRPSMATLIMASEEISKLPNVKIDENGTVVVEVLKNARHYRRIAKIIAIMLIGAKRLQPSNFFHNLRTRRYLQHITNKIMTDLTPSEVKSLMLSLLEQVECADFFAVTTFLQGINITKPTREVESKTKTTVSGQE